MSKLTKEEHINIHRKLHRALDQLAADWIANGELNNGEMRLPSRITLMEFMEWSYQQTIDPEMREL